MCDCDHRWFESNESPAAAVCSCDSADKVAGLQGEQEGQVS